MKLRRYIGMLPIVAFVYIIGGACALMIVCLASTLLPQALRDAVFGVIEQIENALTAADTDIQGTVLDIPLHSFFAVGIVGMLATLVLALVRRWPAEELAKVNMILKLILIPAYVSIFIIGIMFMTTIFTVGLTLLFMVVDVLIIAVTGTFSLAPVIRAKNDGYITGGVAFLIGWLSYLFVLDVLVAVALYVIVRARRSVVNPSSTTLTPLRF